MARGMQRTATFAADGQRYQVFVSEAGMATSAGLVILKGDTIVETLTCADQTFEDRLSTMAPSE